MTKRDIAVEIRRVVDQVVNLVHPLRVVLFGSAVAGNLTVDSDLDFLVIVGEGEDTANITDRLNGGVKRRHMPIDFMVVTPATLDRQRYNPGLVYGEILEQGKDVYAT